MTVMPNDAENPAANALRASETRLQTILDTAVDAFITINACGTIESFNPAAERMFGYPAKEVLGRNVSLLMPPPFCDEHDDYLRRYLETGERKIIGIGREAVGRRKDGSDFPIDLAVGEAVIDGERVFTGVIRDLTERKKLEDNLLRAQRMELVGALTGGIAHDLNNVLAVILTAAENLRLELPTDERRQVLDELTAAARRGTDVVRQILSFARGAGLGDGPLRPSPLLKDLAKLLRHLLPRGIALTTDIPDELPRLVGEEPQLYQVVLNLCVNARDAMPQGGTLSLSARVESSHLVIRVADTGVGIAAEKFEAIFEPFYTTKPPGRGTGLGLATVRNLVRSNGGFVCIESEPGRGAEFRVFWPLLRQEATP
jgi:PAS domain S-box-containing protein